MAADNALRSNISGSVGLIGSCAFSIDRAKAALLKKKKKDIIFSF